MEASSIGEVELNSSPVRQLWHCRQLHCRIFACLIDSRI
jgi:hypothetical protein